MMRLNNKGKTTCHVNKLILSRLLLVIRWRTKEKEIHNLCLDSVIGTCAGREHKTELWI